jgi:hypothetical protein
VIFGNFQIRLVNNVRGLPQTLDFICKKSRSSFVFDKILYFALSLITMAAVIYCISLLGKPSISFVMLFLIPVVCFSGLSVKEYSVLSKKLLNLQG